jgi:hypothetical protein
MRKPAGVLLLGHPCWSRKNWIDVNNDINSPDFLAYNVQQPSLHRPHPLSWPQVN